MGETWRDDTLAEKMINKKVIMIDKDKAYMISSDDGKETKSHEITELQSSIEETDARVVLYSKYAMDNGYNHVIVNSPDSDIFFILLQYANNLLGGIEVIFDTGSRNKRRLISITNMVEDMTQEHCTAIMALHAFTRCDTTSSFKGIGKTKPIKLLAKYRRFEMALT